MRKTLLVLLFAYLATSAYAEVNCGAVDTGDQTGWCTSCASVYSDLVCSSCEAENYYANLDQTRCVNFDCYNLTGAIDNTCGKCSITQTYAIHGGTACSVHDCEEVPDIFTASFCSDCNEIDRYVNYNGSSCTDIDCATSPETKTTDYCIACSSTDIYLNNDASECTNVDCATPPSPITDAYCLACETSNTIANEAGDACTSIPNGVDCNTTPESGSFSNEWCNECADGVNAKTDLTACATATATGTTGGSNANTTSQTNQTTSGAILSITSFILFFASTL